MLSRVAESVYWMSRYLERAENVARFVDVNYNLTLGDDSPLGQQWSPLVYITGDHQDFEERYSDNASREDVLQFLLFDEENPNSILSCIDKAREAARTVREVLPEEIWKQLNKFRLLVRDASTSNDAMKQPHTFCSSVRMTSQLMSGIAESSMLHDEAWTFQKMGRYIERADKTSRIVDVQYFLLLPNAYDVGSPIDIVRWSSLLRSAEGLDMYRRKHGRITPEKVAEFLILDPIFPRSIRFCVDRLEECLLEMTPEDQIIGNRQSERRAGQLVHRLRTIQIEEIIAQGMHTFIDQLQGAINSLGTTMYGDFFNTQRPQQRENGQSQSASSTASDGSQSTSDMSQSQS